MKFYFTDRQGKGRRKMTLKEVREHLSECQIEEARHAKREDPMEEVSYMTRGGFITVELD